MQLTEAIDANDRTLLLDEAYEPAAAEGRYSFLQVGSEVMVVIRGEGTTELYVRRGKAGTAAAPHDAGSEVTYYGGGSGEVGAHATSHEEGGTDEVSLEGLLGTPAELASHLTGHPEAGSGPTILGRTTAGASFYSPGADNRLQAKKITLPSAGLIVSVAAYLRMVGGPGSGAVAAAVYTDSAGVPAKPLGGAYNQAYQLIEAANTDLGWFHIPVGVYVPAAGDVWIAFGNVYQASYLRPAYDEGGSDREITLTQYPWTATVGSGYASSAATTRNHSIRAHFLAV